MQENVQEAPVEETAASTPTEAPAPVKPKAKARTRKAPVTAKGKGKATVAKAKSARQPIPEGMTRSRGSLIPAAKGRQCALVGTGASQCKNPGRWPATIDGSQVVTCTTHKRAAKVVVFAPKPKGRSRKAVTQATASA